MASIFTFQDEPQRVHSPWSTPGSTTPQLVLPSRVQHPGDGLGNEVICGVTKLEPERSDGPCEFKLHLLLRWRRTFTYSSTAIPAWSNQHNRPEASSASTYPISDSTVTRPPYQPSTSTRQARLQQLTTQLLWRLQQSSPFHSSSNKDLVLPILPEATPKLGVPDRPSKLPPGLEESQGALYEVGVADDGTLVGLAEDELEESLNNLRAMAASLGCVVDVHRRVIVGDCEWVDESDKDIPPVAHHSKLWVAEALVRPDNKSIEVVPTLSENMIDTLTLEHDDSKAVPVQTSSTKEHLRVALVGASLSGKSSLLGSLTHSVLDDGRGKSRLSLLKHRHEIASGITSSVAQELLGYTLADKDGMALVNYASGDVSSWPDIHNLADRLVFLSDSPGLPRYSKSTFRALVSWRPHWTVICIAADETLEQKTPASSHNHGGDGVLGASPPNVSLAHLQLCLQLQRPFLVAVTKLDLATKNNLRQMLGSLLSIIRSSGRTPLLLNAPSSQASMRNDTEFSSVIDELVLKEQPTIDQRLAGLDTNLHAGGVPIVMTSAVTGSGMASLHAILRGMPVLEDISPQSGVVFRIDEVFAIPPSKVYSNKTDLATLEKGVVLCGIIESGVISLGDTMLLGPFVVGTDSKDLLHVRALRRASSHHKSDLNSLPRSMSENFSKSLQNGVSRHSSEITSEFTRVRVVSLRNLRLPVASMQAGDTGTVGIQSIDNDVSLESARKGMVLSRKLRPPTGCRSFTACFPASDFGASSSPPLILGGHAIAYIHTIRALVKVTAVALADATHPFPHATGTSPNVMSTADDVFTFDEDDNSNNDTTHGDDANGPKSAEDLRISFKFTSTVEYLEIGDQVLIVPNTISSGPVTGPVSVTTIAGFSGFVGRICES